MRYFRLAVLLAWMALITYWSNQPHLPIDQPVVANALHNLQHRMAHVLAYGLMGLLAYWTFEPKSSTANRASWIIAIGVTSLFGITDEFHQSFIPGRRPAIDDWLLDTASAAAAIWFITQVRRSKHLRAGEQLLAPVVVCAAFAAGIGLAVRPAVSSALGLLRIPGS
jgi:VanZ family protein